jgi:SAM-dependent methyltransferase
MRDQMSELPNDSRRYAPATSRNRQPILDVLRRVLPHDGLVLEVASGSGEHALYFAQELPQLTFQPTDASHDALASIDAWRAHDGLENVRPALLLDAASADWPVAQAAAVLNINMVHISPWACARGLFAGAGRLLPVGGVLYMYGPYKIGGLHTAPSNERFDADLRARDLAWGVRDLEALQREAASHGLELVETVAMPANNFSLVFRKR